MKVGEKRGWLSVIPGSCVNFPNIDWEDITLPEPPNPQNECEDGTHLCSDDSDCSDIWNHILALVNLASLGMDIHVESLKNVMMNAQNTHTVTKLRNISNANVSLVSLVMEAPAAI